MATVRALAGTRLARGRYRAPGSWARKSELIEPEALRRFYARCTKTGHCTKERKRPRSGTC